MRVEISCAVILTRQRRPRATVANHDSATIRGTRCRFRPSPFVCRTTKLAHGAPSSQEDSMKSAKPLKTFAFALACTIGIGLRAAGHSAEVDGVAAFDRLKMLQGTWEATGTNGQQATTTFELTANYTVLLEHYSNAGMPADGQMVTAYHLDGPTLILTHYCIARNQPTLKAERFDPSAGEIGFEFVRGSNLPSANTGHMHRALYWIEDANHFTTSWEFFEDGKKTITEVEHFRRVKS